MNNIRHVVHHELVEYYHGYEGEKVSYGVFFGRVKRYGYDKEEAIKTQKLKSKGKIKTFFDNNGRVCIDCNEYKTWDKFSKSKDTYTGRTGNCLECRNKRKKAYRERTNRTKDKEYRSKTRKLEIGRSIAMIEPRYIDGLPREDVRKVLKYEFKKGYMLQSIIDKTYKRVNMNDNGNKPKFYYV